METSESPLTRSNLTRTLREILEELPLVKASKELTEAVRCYSEEEAANLLGVSAKTLKRERQDGEIQAIRVRGQVRYTHQQLERYLRSRSPA